jgi:hypothetical protein
MTVSSLERRDWSCLLCEQPLGPQIHLGRDRNFAPFHGGDSGHNAVTGENVTRVFAIEDNVCRLSIVSPRSDRPWRSQGDGPTRGC